MGYNAKIEGPYIEYRFARKESRSGKPDLQ